MPHLSPEDLEPVGQDLHRPECVIATPDGDCYVSDWRGGVTAIRSDGSQQTWLARPEGPALHPNGIALMPTGDFLVANLADEGGVWCLARDGSVRPLVTDVDGRALPPANFVTIDARGRIWISVSTRQVPRHRAWNATEADGFIVLLDNWGARIVADGLQYTNEVRPDPSGQWLYVVETFGRRLARFPLAADGSLGAREVVVTFGHGCFPDGFAYDETGGIWITSLVSNRLLRLRPDGTVETVLEDVNPGFVDEAERAYATGTMTGTHLGPIPDTRLQQLTSVGFGGPDRRTVYLGSLHGRCVYRFRAEVRGVAPGGRLGMGVAMTARTSRPTNGRVRLANRAYMEIRRRILDHEYAPSQQVLEQDLAAELGMSRTPVREALVRLTHEQLVQLVPRHGMRVVPLSLQDLRDVYEVITALELAAIERLVRLRPDATTLASLDKALDAMDAATSRGRSDAWVRADEHFHSLLLGLCGNARLVALASSLSDQLHRARLATVQLRGSLEPSNREHRAVVEAIHRGSLRDAQRHHAKHRARTSHEILGLLEQTRLGSF